MKKQGLAPTTIRKDIAFPSLQSVGSPNSLESLLTGFETEMVGIVEVELASCLG